MQFEPKAERRKPNAGSQARFPKPGPGPGSCRQLSRATVGKPPGHWHFGDAGGHGVLICTLHLTLPPGGSGRDRRYLCSLRFKSRMNETIIDLPQPKPEATERLSGGGCSKSQVDSARGVDGLLESLSQIPGC